MPLFRSDQTRIAPILLEYPENGFPILVRLKRQHYFQKILEFIGNISPADGLEIRRRAEIMIRHSGAEFLDETKVVKGNKFGKGHDQTVAPVNSRRLDMVEGIGEGNYLHL